MAVYAFGLVATVGGFVFLPAGASSIECPPLVATPWDGLNVDSEAIPDLPRFLDEIQVTISESRFAASWFSITAGSLSLNLGVVTPTEQDEIAVLEAAGGSTELDKVPWKIVSVPLALAALEKLQADLDSFASSKDIAIISEIRPDVGVVSATVDASSLGAIQSFADSQAACVLQPESGDPLAYKAAISRDDQPPYKAGKRLQILVPIGGPGSQNMANVFCTAGFVMERNGSGQQQLFGSSAGHCSQFSGTLVTDNTQPGVQVGSSTGSNVFRATSPADGDAYTFTSLFSRANTQNKVIVDSNTQRTVDGKRTVSQLTLGLSVCFSGGTTAAERCGGISNLNSTTTFSYTDWSTNPPTSAIKSVRNNVCFSAPANGGDSGSGVYVKKANLTADAVAILSSTTPSSSCSTPTAILGTATNTHVYLG